LIMILRKIKALYKNQAGYTFIEILAVLAISSIISLGALMGNSQLITQTSKNNNYTTANRHVLNAVQWISRDVQMAQYITGAPGFPVTSNLSLSWVTWNNEPSQVVYYVANNQLKRTRTTDNTTEETLIADYVNTNPAMTSCTWDSREFVILFTCTVGEGNHSVNVTKEKTIISRPNL
jgi:prepilin-type N-terminal cleavage/methylation domain-containing protein